MPPKALLGKKKQRLVDVLKEIDPELLEVDPKTGTFTGWYKEQPLTVEEADQISLRTDTLWWQLPRELEWA